MSIQTFLQGLNVLRRSPFLRSDLDLVLPFIVLPKLLELLLIAVSRMQFIHEVHFNAHETDLTRDCSLLVVVQIAIDASWFRVEDLKHTLDLLHLVGLEIHYHRLLNDLD
jgi:hypothetical protein